MQMQILRLTTFYKPKRATVLHFRNLSQTNLNIWNPSYHKENPPAHCIIFLQVGKCERRLPLFELGTWSYSGCISKLHADAITECSIIPPSRPRPPPYFLQLGACSRLQPSLRITHAASRQTLSLEACPATGPGTAQVVAMPSGRRGAPTRNPRRVRLLPAAVALEAGGPRGRRRGGGWACLRAVPPTTEQ